MKVIFLDIDGVLVTWNSLHRWGKLENPKSRTGSMMEPKCVKILNEILAETGAYIVVSSSWRIGRTVEQLKNELSEAGVNVSTLIDKTPTKAYAPGRGHEISHWINEHWMGPPDEITKFCIIDDEISDMDPFKHKVAHTSMEKGLTEVHKKQIIKMLN
jgi:hypothetical protein